MNDNYKGLGTTLRAVRATQHYSAVVAEILILLAFAMSGLDVSLGGTLANIPGLELGWGIMFALGIDTSFVLAWVRVRQYFKKDRQHLWWAIPLALGMSFIVFEPVAIQQLQQSMHISFNQALASLSINLNILIFSRALVAVVLGAILAMTNVEARVVNKQSTKVQPIVQIVEQQVQIVERGVQPIEQGGEQQADSVQPPVHIPEHAQTLAEHLAELVEQGVHINKSAIAKRFNVSHTTVNRAFKRVQNGSTKVTEVNSDQL